LYVVRSRILSHRSRRIRASVAVRHDHIVIIKIVILFLDHNIIELYTTVYFAIFIFISWSFRILFFLSFSSSFAGSHDVNRYFHIIILFYHCIRSWCYRSARQQVNPNHYTLYYRNIILLLSRRYGFEVIQWPMHNRGGGIDLKMLVCVCACYLYLSDRMRARIYTAGWTGGVRIGCFGGGRGAKPLLNVWPNVTPILVYVVDIFYSHSRISYFQIISESK